MILRLIKVAVALALIVVYLKGYYSLVYSDQTVPKIKRLAEWLQANPEAVRRYTRRAQIAAGLFLMALGYHMGKDHYRLIRQGARAAGTIVAYKQEPMPDGRGGYRRPISLPIVRFQAGDRAVEFKDWLSSPAEVLNARVPVLYDPADPRAAMIDRPVWNWIPWAPVLGVGVFLLLVAALSGRPSS